jgi:RHS repeat-associated protein
MLSNWLRVLVLTIAASGLIAISARAQSINPPSLTMSLPTARTFALELPPAIALPPKSAAVPKPAAAAPLVKPANLSCAPPSAPNEIVELARALDWNPDLIYEYVHNNIQTLPIYGSLKGAYGTLIDGVGTPIDQAELMYVLLEQSCYSPQYEIGTIFLGPAQLTAWLGADTNFYDLGRVLLENGFPFPSGSSCSYAAGSPVVCLYHVSGSTTVIGADLPWVWVSVPIPNGGTTYQFEPASKTYQGGYGYDRVAQIANLGSSALQYSQSSFLSAAESGASGIGTPEVSGINRANVRQSLTTYANNLIAYIKANSPTATTNAIIGGATINLLPFYTPPPSGPTLWGQTGLCNVLVGGVCSPNVQAISPTSLSNLNSLRTTLTLTLGYDTGTTFTQLAAPRTFNSSDIYAHRLSVLFNTTTSVPSLLLDGVTQVTATSAVPSGDQLTIRTAINHPTIPCASLPLSQNANGNTTNGNAVISNLSGLSCSLSAGMNVSGAGIPTGSVITQVNSSTAITISNNATATNTGVTLAITGANVDSVRVTPAAGALFVVGTGWGGSTRNMVEKHRKLLQQNAAQNSNNPSAEPVLGEGLAMIGYTWLAEFTDAQARVSEISGVTTTYLHAVGIIGMKGVTGGAQGPFVDLPLNIVTVAQRVGLSSSSPVPTPLESSAFTVIAGVLSVLESGSIEQTQPNATAVSTVKLLDLWSQSGPIFDINDPAISGDTCSYYSSAIRPTLATTYASADLARIDSLVGYASGSCGSVPSTTRVIAPSNGAITVSSSTGSWTGTGYQQLVYNPSGSITAVGNIITGGLSGGLPASVVTPTQISDNQTGTLSGSQYIPPSQDASSVASATNTNVAAASGGSAASQETGADPIDLVVGSYTYAHRDLSVGSGGFPDTLPFVRSFDSSLAQSGRDSSLLGNGWMHNYDLTALPDSDGFEGMGDNSPISGAATIAALYVLQDILNLQSSTAKPTERLIIAAQAEKWLMDHLTNNVVSVTRAGSIERFTLLTNGAYNAPIGSAAVLSGTSTSGYVYQSGDGVTLDFNPTSVTASGKITNWSNAAGAMVGFAYNSSGQLASVCEPNCAAPRRQLNLVYTNNQLTAVNDNTGASPRAVNYSYDANGDLTSAVDPLNYTTTFAYGAVGQLTRIFYPANPGSPFLSMSYDTLGRVNQQTDANGNVFTLRLAGTRGETDDPTGTARVSYFTPRGRTLATIDGLGSSSINNGDGNLTSYVYDGLDRVTSVTYPAGWSRSFTYDAYSNPLSITSTPPIGSPLSPVTRYLTYISPVVSLPNFEEPVTATDPLGLITTYAYDAFGNRTQIIADAGASPHVNATSWFTYDSDGRILTATNPLGSITNLTYDLFGDLVSSVRDYGGLNQTTSWSYDPVGNVLTSTDPNGNVTTTGWDADRRLVSAVSPAGVGGGLTTAYTYDANGDLLQTQQSSNGQLVRTVASTYTLAGKVATTTDANGNETRYAYDANERLSQTTDPVGNVTVFGYDALSRLASLSNPAIQANPLWQKTYTPDGLVASFSDAFPNTTNYAYDGFDRLSTTTFPDASTEVLTYDADSNVSTRKTRRGDAIAFAYDTLNRPCTKVWATSPIACGGASSSYLVSYAYDLASRLIGVSDNSAAISAPSASASYTAAYAYDPRNKLINVTWSPATAQTLPAASTSVTFGYSYDGDNRRIGQTATDKNWWNYPTTAASIAYTANNLNQYSAVGSVSPTYDGDGDLTSDGTFTYCYDDERRLTSILSAGTCASPTATVASYAYDARGRRKSKTVGSATTYYATDADNREVLEYSAGAPLNWYSFALGPDAVLNQMNVAGSTRATLIPDVIGSIAGSLDAASGTLTKFGYQTFGENPTLTSGGYRYTARRLDPETLASVSQPSGLYYYRARMYAPGWGRFLQPDPAGYLAGTNLYAYVNDDPLNLVDPYGLTPDGPQAAAAGGVNGGGGAQAPPIVSTVGSGADFYVNSGGTAIPAIGYRAIGAQAVSAAESGNIMSPSGVTYITFNNLNGLTGEQAAQLLQLKYAPSVFATFNTLQIANDLTIPGGRWNTSPIPEPITSTYPEYGTGGGTQAITNTPIPNFRLQPFTTLPQ